VYCNVLQYVTVCCSVLQYAGVCCSELQYAAVCHGVWQCVAVCHGAVQCTAVCCSESQSGVLQCSAARCSVSRCVVVCHGVLQCAAVCHGVQCVIVCCSESSVAANRKNRSPSAQAKYTVRVNKLLLTNCVQAHDDCLEVLPRVILYLSTRQPQTIGPPGHVSSQFLEFLYFQEFCLRRPNFFFKNPQKIIKKKFAGLLPAPPPYGAAPLPSMKVGAKCLAAAVLAHRDRVLSLQFNHYRKHQDDEAAQYRGFKVVFCARPF